MQLLNFVIDVMLKNEVYLYSHSSNEWLDELEYYTHCHLHIVLLIVQPIGWTNESTICISVEHLLNTFRVRNR